jgi:FMN reductase
MTILLIAGSPSLASRSTRLLQHSAEKLALLGHHYTSLHVRNLPAEALLHADFSSPDIQVARAQVAQAEAIVVATPVYKASFSGILKAFLDLLPQDGFEDKLVLPLATGGSQSHMLALDYALRPVLSALGARHVLPSIYATDAQVGLIAEPALALDDSIAARISNGVETLSASLLALRATAVVDFQQVPFNKVRCSV